MPNRTRLSVTVASLLSIAVPWTVGVGCTDGCGQGGAGSGGRGQEPRAQVPAPVEPTAGEAAGYSVHEWGLIDARVDNARMWITAGSHDRPGVDWTSPEGAEHPASNDGPGDHPPAQQNPAADPQVGSPNVGTTPRPPVDTRPENRRPMRKPVLYIHLAEDGEGGRRAPPVISASVRVAGGRILEHFPPTLTGEDSVRWSNIVLQRAACTGLSYPLATEAMCAAAPDGVCEVAELGEYETDDSACLLIDERRTNHLFYRGETSSLALPVTLTRRADGRGIDATLPPGSDAIDVMRIAREPDRVRTERVHLDGGATTTIAYPEGGPQCAANDDDCRIESMRTSRSRSDHVRSFVHGGLSEAGLTAAESEAFDRAWLEALLTLDAAGPRDMVIYFLPREALDAAIPLDFQPAPDAVRRAMLIRVALDPSPD